MSEQHGTPNRNGGGHGLWIAVTAAVLLAAVISARPVAWARPSQAPDYQTVPTLTPTPRPPDPGQTPEPPASTNTPGPGQPSTATPAVTAPPPPLPPPGQTPVAPTVAAPARSVTPRTCLAVPTPGFAPVPLTTLTFEGLSDQFLVVPGQAISLRLVVTNPGKAPARDVLICSPLPPELVKGQPQASQGRARVDRLGLVAELGDLAPGRTAEVALTMTIPGSYPLGGVIENQAWLFTGDQRGSTRLLTWALPPAWLPATGR